MWVAHSTLMLSLRLWGGQSMTNSVLLSVSLSRLLFLQWQCVWDTVFAIDLHLSLNKCRKLDRWATLFFPIIFTILCHIKDSVICFCVLVYSLVNNLIFPAQRGRQKYTHFIYLIAQLFQCQPKPYHHCMLYITRVYKIYHTVNTANFIVSLVVLQHTHTHAHTRAHTHGRTHTHRQKRRKIASFLCFANNKAQDMKM